MFGKFAGEQIWKKCVGMGQSIELDLLLLKYLFYKKAIIKMFGNSSYFFVKKEPFTKDVREILEF